MTKDWFATDGQHHYFLCVIFLVAALNIFLRLNFLPLTVSTDGDTYIATAQLLSGENVTPYPGRLLKPLAPFGIALFASLFHGDMVAGFLTLNILSYFLLAGAMYMLLLLFTTDRLLAMLGALMFISTYPVLEYGLNLYSEMGSWLLFVVAIFGSVRYFREASWKNFSIALCAVALGLLWKEYAILAGIFFGLILLFEPTCPWKKKLLRVGLLAFSSAAVVSVMAWTIYAEYHYTYLDWLRDAAAVNPAQSQHTLYFIAKSIFGVFFLAWGLVLAGAWNWRNFPQRDQWTLVLLFPPSMMFLLWTFVSSRLYYVIAPLLSVLALHGLRTLSERRLVRVSLVVAVILGSYAWLFTSGMARSFLQ